MVVRRRNEHEEQLGDGVWLVRRWDTERDIVSFANALVVEVDGERRTVELFDCTHDDVNDHHRYDRDGYKHPAVTFHFGTPAEGYRTSMWLIREEFERMIERWEA